MYLQEAYVLMRTFAAAFLNKLPSFVLERLYRAGNLSRLYHGLSTWLATHAY